MKNQTIPQHGGSRTGAGRKPKAGPTKTKTFRIPDEDLILLQSLGVENLNTFYVAAGKYIASNKIIEILLAGKRIGKRIKKFF